MQRNIRIRLTLMGILAAGPVSAQTLPAPSPLNRSWFEGSAGAMVGGHVRATEMPVCRDLGQLCIPTPAPLSVGGLISLGGRVTERLSVVAEIDAYTQKWNTLDGGVHREYVRFLMTGPRIYLPIAATGGRIRFVGQALFGAARRELVGVSDPVAQHRAVDIGAGLDWLVARDTGAPSIRVSISRIDAGNDGAGLSEWRTAVGLTTRFGTLAAPPPRLNPNGRLTKLAPPATGRLEMAAALTLQTPSDVNLPPRCGALELPCGSPRSFPDLGLVASAAAHTAGVISVVGELSAYANLWRSSSGPEGEEINHVRAALGGVRFRTPPLWIGGQQPAAMRMFAQVLAGPESSSVTTRHVAIQPGMGADFYTGLVTMRCEMDYRFAAPGERDLSGARFAVGLVFAR